MEVGWSHMEKDRGKTNLTDMVDYAMGSGLMVKVVEGKRVEGGVEGNSSGNLEEGAEEAVADPMLRYD